MNKKQLKADVKEDFGGELIAKITTESIDRDGEVLIPQGMNAVEYEANPVLLVRSNPSVGKATMSLDHLSLPRDQMATKASSFHPSQKHWYGRG